MRRLITAVVVAATLTGCGGGGPAAPQATETTRATQVATTAPTVATIRPGLTRLIAHTAPAIGAPKTATLPARTRYGSPATFAVIGHTTGWLQVQLPTRPNGSTGWLQTSQVTTRPTTESITVDLATRRITITAGGRTHTAPVAIGAPATPTPRGAFYVTDRVLPKPGSPYGAFALGLSAHSDVLRQFGSGDGQIGIHGTNTPASIGQAATSGCIRVDDATAELLRQIGLGAPATIH